MITKDIVTCIAGIEALCVNETLTCVGICNFFIYSCHSFFDLFAFASFVLLIIFVVVFSFGYFFIKTGTKFK